MSYYTQARQEDEQTFGNGRYPKRSRRDVNGYIARDYHSLSVSRIHRGRPVPSSCCSSNITVEANLYHCSLSADLFARHSGSNCTSQRYSTSTCSTTSHRKRRAPPIPIEEERTAKIRRKDSNQSSRVSLTLIIKCVYMCNLSVMHCCHYLAGLNV